MNSGVSGKGRKSSISRSLIISVLVIIIVLVASIVTITSVLLTQTYDTQIRNEIHNTSAFVDQAVGAFMSEVYNISYELADNPSILTMDTGTQTPILERSVQRNQYFELLYIQDTAGDQTGRSSGTLGNRADRWWFVQMMSMKQPFVSPSYYSVATNMPTASVFIPMKEGNEFIGIFASDIRLGHLQSLVDEFSNQDKGQYSFIIDGGGTVVAHPDSMYVDTMSNFKTLTRTVSGNEESFVISDGFKSVISSVMGGRDGVELFVNEGKSYYAGYNSISLPGTSESWSVVTLQDKDMAMSVVTNLIIISIIVAAAIAAVSVFIVIIMTKRITRPIKALSQKLGVIATGNLHITLDENTKNDEIGECIDATSGFVNYVKVVAAQLEKIADGDLTVRVKMLSDEDTIGKSLSTMVDNLNDMFGNINTATTQVATGSKQVADGSQTLAQGATEQAASIEELSNSIGEIAEKTKSNAKTAEKTAKLSDTIRESAVTGSRQMDEMVSAVKEINDASQSISKIIKTIDDIAFQTNILALNAAVEAARAGQHGKGFAVVAEEVRNLATKSAEAAKDTGAMIQNSMEKADLGSRIAGETAKSLQDIVIGIEESVQLVTEIAKASEEQSRGIMEVTVGIDQVAQVVQQNSATAEQSAAASEEMSSQSIILEDLISQFRLKDAEGTAVRKRLR